MPSTLSRSLAVPALVASVALGAALNAAGASRREQMDLLERDLQDLEQRLVQMQDEQSTGRADLERQIRDIRAELALDDPGRRTPADLAARLDSVENDVRVLYEQQNELTQRVSLLVDRVEALYRRSLAAEAAAAAAAGAAPAGTAGAPTDAPAQPVDPSLIEEETVGARGSSPAAATGSPAASAAGGMTEPLVDPEELYDAARADYSRGSHDLAVAGFEEFLERFPESELADNALYWIGESHYAQRDYDRAVEAFDTVVAQHPDADKAPDASFKRGLALLELNRTGEGILQLQRVRDRYPGTPAASLARQKLQALGLQ